MSGVKWRGISPTTREIFTGACRHDRVEPIGNGWGRCAKCGDSTFPLTPATAGQCEKCGRYGNCICKEQP